MTSNRVDLNGICLSINGHSNVVVTEKKRKWILYQSFNIIFCVNQFFFPILQKQKNKSISIINLSHLKKNV